MRLRGSTIITLLFLQALSAQLALGEEKPSHFVEALEPARTLPKGVELEAVPELLHTKIRLRMDIQGEALPAKTARAGLYAAEKLEAGKPVLLSAVSRGVPGTLSDVVPPGRVLLTLFYPAAKLAELALCSPYDNITLGAAAGGNRIAVTEEARLISYEAHPETPGEQALIVLALTPEAKSRMAELGMGRAGAPDVICTKAGKYE